MSLGKNIALFGALLTICVAVLFIGAVTRVFAVSYTWDGGGATNNWSDCDNWSTDTCLLPADDAVFDGTSVKNSTIDIAAFNDLTISSGYTGIITQSLDVVMSGDINQADGTYNGGSNNLTLIDFNLTNGAFNAPDDMTAIGVFTSIDIDGGVFTAPSNILSAERAFAVDGPSMFVHNGGTVAFDDSGTGSRHNISCGNAVFNLVTFGVQKRFLSDCDLPLGHNPITAPNASGWPSTYLDGATLRGTGTLTTGQAGTSRGFIIESNGAQFIGFSGLVAGRITLDNATVDLSSISTATITFDVTLQNGSNFTPPDDMTVGDDFRSDATSTFTHNNGTVRMTGTDPSIEGDNTFYNLYKENAASMSTITFENGTTQTIAGSLRLSGTDEDTLLSLVSDSPGTQWMFDVSGSHTLRYLSIADGVHSGTGELTAYDSEDVSNNNGFVFGAFIVAEEETVTATVTESLAETGDRPTIAIAMGAVIMVIAAFVYQKSRRRVYRLYGYF